MKKIPILACLTLLLISFSGMVSAGLVPDTGQTTSYTDTFGEDSDYTINSPSYTKLSASGDALPYTAAEWAMVQDDVTGLTWEVKTDDGSIHDKDTTYTWTLSQGVFVSFLNGESFGGFSDWRMPAVRELTSIVFWDGRNPAASIDFFPLTRSSFHWTSAPLVGSSTEAWSVYFLAGAYGFRETSLSSYARAVRGEWGQVSEYVDNGEGTVTDISTGLMWQQQAADPMTWEDALAYCEALPLTPVGGHTDWRLPSINELQSMLDYSRNNPAMDTDAFPDETWNWYWTSTTFIGAGSTANAWRVDFEDGFSNSDDKTDTNRIRCVRGGQNQMTDHLFLTSPVQATEWVVGTSMPITWDTPSDPEITGNVKISLSRDGGKTFDTVIADSTENDGAFDWTLTGPDSVNGLLKIEPIDDPFTDKGTSQGLFTITTNQLPSEPSYISPDNGATGQPIATDISWEPSTDPDEGDTVTYDVYFGRSMTPPSVASDYTGTTYDPGPLNYNATYFWKIVACDNREGCTEGAVWRFSTVTVKGDVNGDGDVDLTDAILAFQVACGLVPDEPVFDGGDVNGDGKIGLADVIYIIQVVSGLRL